MCGIFGFIGKSKNDQVTYELVTQLMKKTETRGEHATGFWAAENDNKEIWYDKEGIKSTEYVKNDIWKNFENSSTDIFIGHCRLSSITNSEKINKNNHPHVSKNKCIALVHNGKIPEYNTIKQRYDLRSDCDSEILLAMYETGILYENKKEEYKEYFPTIADSIAWRGMGMKEIFTYVNKAFVATAIAERLDNGERILWLYRDEHRPLHMVDLRESLGQIFFVSTPEIWKAAIEACSNLTRTTLPKEQEVYIISQDHCSVIHYNPNEEKKWTSIRFRIEKPRFVDANEDNLTKIERNNKMSNIEVISRLDDSENIKDDKKKV